MAFAHSVEHPGIVVGSNKKSGKIIRIFALCAVFPLTHDLEILYPESAAGNFWSKNVIGQFVSSSSMPLIV